MSRKRALQKYIDLLTTYNTSYREGKPLTSDKEYDNLLDNFKRDYPEDYIKVREDLLESTGDFQHKFLAGSLDKLKSEEKTSVKDWLSNLDINENKSFIITPKLDGLSIILYYSDGNLIYAVTRGDGNKGVIQTNKLKHIVPNTIENKDKELIVRGECIFSKEGYNKYILLDSNKDYKNPRNAAVGLINSLDFTEEKIKCLDFVAYNLRLNDSMLNTYKESLDLLKNLGFNTNTYTEVSYKNLDNDLLDSWYEEFKETIPYEIDGVVIQSNNKFNENKILPDFARAYKVNLLESETIIKDIEWNISKSGYMVPTGIIEPVVLGGAEINRVTLFNYAYVIKNNIGIGSKVIIQKSGDIIPYVKEVLTTSNENKVPTYCPHCGSELKVSGVELQCQNINCIPQRLKQIAFLLKNLTIENAGETSLFNWGITDIDKLLNFKPDFKYKNQIKFYNELKEKLYTSSPKKLISCMDFDGVSIKTFKKLFRNYFTGDICQFVEIFGNYCPSTIWMRKTANIIKTIDGIGLTTLNQIRDLFIKRNKEILDKIISSPNYNYSNSSIDSSNNETLNTNLFKGLTFCFTGALSNPRQMYEEIVQLNGGEVRSNVTKSLSYLVTNDLDPKSSKFKKAKELNIKVINEEEFLKLNGQS